MYLSFLFFDQLVKNGSDPVFKLAIIVVWNKKVAYSVQSSCS